MNTNKLLDLLEIKPFRLLIFATCVCAAIMSARLFYFFFPQIVIIINDEYHVHHFVFGVLILTISGLVLSFIDDRRRYLGVVILGIGVGFVADEFTYILVSGDALGYASDITVFITLLYVVTSVFFARYLSRK